MIHSIDLFRGLEPAPAGDGNSSDRQIAAFSRCDESVFRAGRASFRFAVFSASIGG